METGATQVAAGRCCSLRAPVRRGLLENAPSPGGEQTGREPEGGRKPAPGALLGPFVQRLPENH